MQQTVSTQTLIKASIGSTLIAIIVLITFILPAEYNIDPTGLGQKLGLTRLALAGESSDSVVMPDMNNEASSNELFQTIEVTVPAGQGIEYKFAMAQHSKMQYEWLTDGDALYFDLHGEPEGDTSGYFESYTIATANEMKGSFTAPFTGSHGWYWKNKTKQPIAIQLLVKGQFTVIGLMK